jgi:hypothetical protein
MDVHTLRNSWNTKFASYISTHLNFRALKTTKRVLIITKIGIGNLLPINEEDKKMSNKTRIKNVIFLGIFAFGISLIAKDISLPADLLGFFIAGIGAIRFI